MKILFNFNNKRFEAYSELKSVDKADKMCVNVYNITLKCDDKSINFSFSDIDLNGESPNEMPEENLKRALMFMAQDAADYVYVGKDEMKLIALNEWENADKKMQKYYVKDIKKNYKIFEYLVNDDSMVDEFENLVGTMWLNNVGYEIID